MSDVIARETVQKFPSKDCQSGVENQSHPFGSATSFREKRRRSKILINQLKYEFNPLSINT